MLRPSCSIWELMVVLPVLAMGRGCLEGDYEPQIPMDRTEEPEKTRGPVVKAAELNRDLLVRFRVPERSTASDESPLRLEAEIVRAEDRPPFTLRAYVLLPTEAKEQTAENAQEAKEYVKLPFGKMDVVAPLGTKKPFLLFPYEDAEAVRKRVKPGDLVLVGIEAIPLTANDEGNEKRLDVDVKVRRLISW